MNELLERAKEIINTLQEDVPKKYRHRTAVAVYLWLSDLAAFEARKSKRRWVMKVEFVQCSEDDDGPDHWIWIAFIDDDRCHFQSSGSISPKAACELDARRVAGELGMELEVTK